MIGELLHGAGCVCLYFFLAASFMFLCRWLFPIPNEIFRKALHFVLLISYIPFLFAFETWWLSALAAAVLAVAIYPALAWAERFPRFSSFVTERKSGEFKHSLLLAFSMLAVCICICWGWLNDRLLVLACMYAWGVGDAFAALIGKAFGRHHFRFRLADPHKSAEGSAAMFVTSALTVFCVLLCRGGMGIGSMLIVSAAGALAASAVELVTPDGMDTITCPSAAMAVILPLTALLGGLA